MMVEGQSDDDKIDRMSGSFPTRCLSTCCGFSGRCRSSDNRKALDVFFLDYNKGEKNLVSLELDKAESGLKLQLFGQVVLDRGHKSSNIPVPQRFFVCFLL